jgi:(S)-citramalyl-CoA lyase
VRVRSWLCASALNVDLAAKAAACGADVIHFDLEDAVASSYKARARRQLRARLGAGLDRPTAVRLNGLRTLEGLRDLVACAELDTLPDVVILAKASLPGDVELAAEILGPRVALYPVIESASSLCELRDLTTAPPGLSGVIFGIADFAVDMGVDPRRAEFPHVKRELVLLARRLGVRAIDAPCFSLRDPDRLRAELSEISDVGFDGKIALHPSQVAPINEFFTPAPEALFEAQRVIDAHAGNPDGSVLTLDDEMVGPPHIAHARRVLRAASDVTAPIDF